jgi:hypothetical protein
MTDRISHGVPPLGYRTVPHPSGSGRRRRVTQKSTEAPERSAANRPAAVNNRGAEAGTIDVAELGLVKTVGRLGRCFLCIRRSFRVADV